MKNHPESLHSAVLTAGVRNGASKTVRPRIRSGTKRILPAKEFVPIAFSLTTSPPAVKPSSESKLGTRTAVRLAKDIQRQVRIRHAAPRVPFTEVLASLNQAAQQNRAFPPRIAAEVRHQADRSAEFWTRILEEAVAPANHGRVRWLFYELLARHPIRQLQEQLVGELAKTDDPWVLNGVVLAVHRTKIDDDLREPAHAAFVARLEGALSQPAVFRDPIWSAALAACIHSFASFSRCAELELLAQFALGDWEAKPRVNAFHALSRTVARYATDSEVDHFFTNRQSELESVGRAFAEIWRSSDEAAVLLLAWVEFMLARLGPEGGPAIEIAKSRPMLVRPVRRHIGNARKVLAGRGLDPWLESRSEELGGWLDELEKLAPTDAK